MMIVKCFDNLEFLIEDDEAENIKNSLRNNIDGFIKLRSGDVINPKGILAITEPEKIPYWDAYPLNKDGRSFMREGERITLSPQGLEEVKYKPHPKYKVKEFIKLCEKQIAKLRK